VERARVLGRKEWGEKNRVEMREKIRSEKARQKEYNIIIKIKKKRGKKSI